MLIDIIHDSLVKLYFSIPKKAIKLHNGAVISALSDSNNGKNFKWDYDNYFGKVRIVKSFMKKIIYVELGYSKLEKQGTIHLMELIII